MVKCITVQLETKILFPDYKNETVKLRNRKGPGRTLSVFSRVSKSYLLLKRHLHRQPIYRFLILQVNNIQTKSE